MQCQQNAIVTLFPYIYPGDAVPQTNDVNVNDYEHVLAWLDLRPPRRKLKKIERRLKGISAEHDVEIIELLWWDMEIGTQELYIRIRTISHRKEMLGLFRWKTRNGSDRILLQKQASWTKSTTAPNGMQWEADVPSYELMKVAFRRWLNEGIHSIPVARPKRSSPRSRLQLRRGGHRWM